MKKIIIVSICCVLALVAGIILWMRLPDPRLKHVSREIFSAKIEGNADYLWDAACNELQELFIKEHGSKEAFLEMVKEGQAIYSNLVEWEIGNLIDFGERATVPVVLKYKDGSEDIFYLYLIKIDGIWKVHR